MQRHNNLSPINPNEVPVSSFLAVTIITVFSLYATSAIKSVPCGKDVLSNFFATFVHKDAYHLIANTYSMYSLSRVERELGTKRFFSLILFLLLFNTAFETVLHSMNDSIPCSIGLSGILFGIATWELVTNRGLDFHIASSIGLSVLLPSLQRSDVSLTGHVIGAISGVIGGLLWKRLGYNGKMENGVNWKSVGVKTI